MSKIKLAEALQAAMLLIDIKNDRKAVEIAIESIQIRIDDRVAKGMITDSDHRLSKAMKHFKKVRGEIQQLVTEADETVEGFVGDILSKSEPFDPSAPIEVGQEYTWAPDGPVTAKSLVRVVEIGVKFDGTQRIGTQTKATALDGDIDNWEDTPIDFNDEDHFRSMTVRWA